MSAPAPYVGRRVLISGTSRQDLNGAKGVAADYDREKGRYTVRLDNGQSIALKPGNLEVLPEQAAATPNGASSAGAGTSAPSGSAGPGGVSWQTIAFVVVGIGWLFSQLQGGGGASGAAGLWDGEADDAEYDYSDDGYSRGLVREVTTLDQLRGALAHHADSTGLPVVVDFFSHSCGPCRMIAPTFKRLAKELKGQVAFLKVDVNRNYEASSACNVRGMPTFQFYLNRKKISQFSGADERSLRRYAASAIEKAQEAGAYADKEVTSESLREFYEKHDPAKASEAGKLAEKYAQKTAQLVRVCKQKYGTAPLVSPRRASSDSTAAREQKKASPAAKAPALSERPLEELRADMQRIKAEMERRGATSDAEGREEEEDDKDDIPFQQADEVAQEGVHDVVVLGGGPAGLTAAIYVARAGFKPLVLAPVFGGQLLGKGVDVENYPGVVGEQATGRGLVELMRRQAHSFEARFVDALVLGTDFGQRPFRIRVNETDREISASAVIMACGAESRWLQVEGEQDLRGQGVSACATCDGFLFRNQDVAVIGGGDHAMEDALHLARTSRRVTVIHRRDSFRASKILADRVLNHSSIDVRWNSTVESFHGSGSLTHLTLRSSGTGSSEKLPVGGAFVAIGHEPRTEFLRGQVDTDEAGYVRLRGDGNTATSVPGVFAAGDVADRTYRQAITASGTGAMAALDAERFLHEQR